MGMATMLNGAAIMDAALLLIAGNESCPQPQTSEHLAAIEIMKLKHIIDAVCEYITKKIPIPPRDFLSEPRLIVIRSFDVNKPGCEVDDLKGGVAGGSILRGVLKVGQEIEIRPGLVSKDRDGKLKCQ